MTPVTGLVVGAPGRVNLIGDHTDYNEGFVFPMAIDRECRVERNDRAGGRLVARSGEVGGTVELAVADLAAGTVDPREVEPAWGRFVAGVARAVVERGARPHGLELAISSTVPTGSGLSSSSALSVALTLSLARAWELELDGRDAARTALAGEVHATGVPGGLMDQLTSLFGRRGHALLIDCRDLAIEPVPLPDDIGVLVVHSGVARTLAGSAYAQRRAECEAIAAELGVPSLRDATPGQVARLPRARHVVSENRRVLDFVAALRAHDPVALGALLLESHASLRDDYEVSIPELDALVDALVGAGAYGARLTGAGFGGCVVALGPAPDLHTIAATATSRYRAATNREPAAFVCRAVDGAGPRMS
ncbi:MAG: galactokinase [Acidimicrobiia bacterium]